MTTIDILLSILIFLAVMNLIVLFVLGAFVVRFRQNVINLFGDFADLLENLFGTIPAPTVDVKEEPKTWDQKYEEELTAAALRLREDSGLQSLPMNQELSWGAPPALNLQNAKGLTIEDKQSSM